MTRKPPGIERIVTTASPRARTDARSRPPSASRGGRRPPAARTIAAALAASLAVLGACTSAPRYRRAAPVAAEVSVGDRVVRVDGRDVVRRAEAFLGTPYRFGGASERGMDCSGLVVRVYEAFGIALPRRSRDQARFGAPVPRDGLRPGDLVFFRAGGGRAVDHVGIYAGGGQFIHASTRSRRVRYDRLDNRYFRNRFVTARRIL